MPKVTPLKVQEVPAPVGMMTLESLTHKGKIIIQRSGRQGRMTYA